MKKHLNKITATCLLASALWIPSTVQAPASEILEADGAIHMQERFKDLPITPVKSDFEDCFNDSIPDDPIPQG